MMRGEAPKQAGANQITENCDGGHRWQIFMVQTTTLTPEQESIRVRPVPRNGKGTVQQSVSPEPIHGSRQQDARERLWAENADKEPAILVEASI
jgi:hypothetical protein